MLYQRFHDTMERWMPRLLAAVQAGGIFEFRVNAHEVLPKGERHEEYQSLIDNFRLPYPCTTIEDTASCVVLMRLPEYKGLVEPIIFVEFLEADAAGNATNDSLENRLSIQEAMDALPIDIAHIGIGWVSSPGHGAKGWAVAGAVNQVYTVEGLNITLLYDISADPAEQEQQHPMILSTLKNAMTAIEELAFISTLPKFPGWPEITTDQPIFTVDLDGSLAIKHATSDRIL